MEVTAYAKNIRTSPQKVRLVTDQIKKFHPQEAIKILEFISKKSAMPVKKVILSAIANAKNNHGLSEETLVFKEILVEKGRVAKRSRAVARGRQHSILKRTSHIKIILEGQEKKEIAKVSQPKADRPLDGKEAKETKTEPIDGKADISKEKNEK
jgi:large subunit ribosomal protein L22